MSKINQLFGKTKEKKQNKNNNIKTNNKFSASKLFIKIIILKMKLYVKNCKKIQKMKNNLQKKIEQ